MTFEEQQDDQWTRLLAAWSEAVADAEAATTAARAVEWRRQVADLLAIVEDIRRDEQ